KRELQNTAARYLVLTELREGPGEASAQRGMWGALRRIVGGEAPGVGERLLIACIELAQEYDQQLITLEVRASNDGAQLLYEKYGFDRAGLRVRYYSDNHEDAVIMTTPAIAS